MEKTSSEMMVSVPDPVDCGTDHVSQQQRFQTADIRIACDRVAKEKEISQYKSEMVAHNNIMASK